MAETIIVVSDNHGQRAQIDYIRNTYPSDYYFFHCGDSEMYPDELAGFACVRGNNDYMGFENRRIVRVGGHRILITHGHLDMYGTRLQMLAKKAKIEGCDIVCFGHLHKYIDTEIDGIRLLNPGSVWHNRDGSAPSYMVVTIDGDTITAERINWNRDLLK